MQTTFLYKGPLYNYKNYIFTIFCMIWVLFQFAVTGWTPWITVQQKQLLFLKQPILIIILFHYPLTFQLLFFSAFLQQFLFTLCSTFWNWLLNPYIPFFLNKYRTDRVKCIIKSTKFKIALYFIRWAGGCLLVNLKIENNVFPCQTSWIRFMGKVIHLYPMGICSLYTLNDQ